MATPPSNKERKVIREYLANPQIMTQIEVMRRLNIADRNNFYRILARCTIADRLDAINNQ